MRASAGTLRLVMLVAAASLAVIVLALWALTSGQRQADAVPLLRMGLDFNPASSPASGVYDPLVLPTFENCAPVVVGSQVSIDVFVLDVTGLVAFDSYISYNPTNLQVTGSFTGTTPTNPIGGTAEAGTATTLTDNAPAAAPFGAVNSLAGGMVNLTSGTGAYQTRIIASNTGDTITVTAAWTTNPAAGTVYLINPTLFMSAQVGSNVSNVSQNSPNQLTGVLATPDSDGTYQAAAADTGNVSGDTGSGVLARVTFKGMAPGVSAVSIPSLDFNGDTIVDARAFLRDANGVLLGDINGDGLFDGPFINQAGSIAVGQDNDLDGLFDFACPGQPTDNCPNVNNPTQSDIDRDGAGDPCDGDSDGEGYWNVQEQAWGSDTLNASKTPDVCDGLDNDGDGTIDEGFDFTRPGGGAPNGIPDCTENVDTDGDTIPNPTDTDDDNDGTIDTTEIKIRTDTLARCPRTTGINGHYAWMPDTDNSRLVSIGDVLRFIPVFNVVAVDPRYNLRFDWNGDGRIGLADILLVLPYFNTTCTP